MMFTPTTCIHLAQNQSSSVLGTETIVLQYEAGNYYELNDLGGFIWSLLQANQVMTVTQIKQRLLQEFEVDESICQQELTVFLDSLFHERLIEVTA